MRVGTLIFLSENFPVCTVFPIAKIAAFGSSLYLDYRSIRSDSSRLIIEGGIWKPCSSLGFLPVT